MLSGTQQGLAFRGRRLPAVVDRGRLVLDRIHLQPAGDLVRSIYGSETADTVSEHIVKAVGDLLLVVHL